MLKLQRALHQMNLWITTEVVASKLKGYGNLERLKGIDAVIADQVEKFTTGEWEITVEEFVDYSNKDLADAGFGRNDKINKEGYVMYLVPITLYPLMPEELVVFDVDDVNLTTRKTMREILKRYSDSDLSYGVVVQEDGTDV